MSEIQMSTLSKTWIFDIDGTLLKHNGYKTKEELLPGVKEFFLSNINENDKVILITARSQEQAKSATSFLEENFIRYDLLITDLPHGERIMYNDIKGSGLKTCYSFNLVRDKGLKNLKKFKFCK